MSEHGMSDARWMALERDPTLKLTPEEIASGWHFCPDWDGMLIHKLNPEFEACNCTLEAWTPV